MNLLRQGSQYLAFGLVQLLLDWAVFVASTALGMPTVPGNLLGRTSGALLGFWLNGRFTFASKGRQHFVWSRFARFFALWLVTTAVSTWLVSTVATTLGLQLAWLAKPTVEGGLALLTFFLMRHFVFR